MVDLKDFQIEPRDLAAGRDGAVHPFLMVNLSDALRGIPDLRLPACPLIGTGDPAHELAARLDMMVEAPVTLDRLAASITAHPHAAAVLVHLLRGIEGQPLEAALVQESIAYGLLQGGADHARWLAGQRRGEERKAGSVRLERTGDRLSIFLDRPEARNAIDRPMRDALSEAFQLAVLDASIEAVELRGVGKAFCVGADLGEFGTTRDPVEAHRIRMATLPAHAIIGCRERMRVHIQGACVGAGLEMAAFAARVTASADSWFQLPELAMGLIPGAGGCVSVSRRIGRQRAALMILSGKRIGAKTALDWGLIDAIIEES